MPKPTCQFVLILSVVLGAAGAADAQSAAEDPTPVLIDEPQFVDLRVVDQRVEDLGGLAGSLRQVDPGLRQSNDFSRVYALPGNEQYMRNQGALYAVFPRSVYVPGSGDAAIPPGTVFLIGPPSPFDPLSAAFRQPAGDDLPHAGAAGSAELRWDTRLINQPGAQPQVFNDQPRDAVMDDNDAENADALPMRRHLDRQSSSGEPAAAVEEGESIVTSSDHRAARVRERLRQAVAVVTRPRH